MVTSHRNTTGRREEGRFSNIIGKCCSPRATPLSRDCFRIMIAASLRALGLFHCFQIYSEWFLSPLIALKSEQEKLAVLVRSTWNATTSWQSPDAIFSFYIRQILAGVFSSSFGNNVIRCGIYSDIFISTYYKTYKEAAFPLYITQVGLIFMAAFERSCFAENGNYWR